MRGWIRIGAGPLALLMLLSPVLANLGMAAGTAATVRELTGVCYVTPAGGEKAKLAVGVNLALGDTVEVTRNSSLTLMLSSGTAVKLGAGTKVTLGGTGVRQAEFTTWYGSLLSVVTGLTAGSQYRVATPTATAAVRGTVFLTQVAEDGTTEVQVLKGTVGTSALAGGDEVLVMEGFKSVVAPGALATVPVALTAAEIAAVEAMGEGMAEFSAAGVGAGAAGGAGVGAAVGSTWWIWALVGVAVAGGVTAGIVLGGEEPTPDGGDALADPPDHP